ncbi:MAG: hypothetical protein O7F08_05720 [Deltaproteobacteria bacterium]|nr:hypothetical protein [Deltaproteobacteria bacterium]
MTIIIGAIVITCGLVTYGFVHYGKLKGIRDVRVEADAEYTNKRAHAEVSKSLQAEIAGYEARRKAIQEIVKNRILHSRKLDEFLDVIHNRGDRSAYYVWLNGLRVSGPRSSRRKKAVSGGGFAFDGFAAANESVALSRVTTFRRALRKDAFFKDFSGISMPTFKAIKWDDGLEPASAGRFSYSMTLRPLGWQHSTKRKK